MAVALSAKKPLEERIDRSERTLACRRIPYHTGTSRSQRCEHHHDLYPCSKPRIWRRGKSAEQNVDFYKYPCKICANSQKMIYNKKIRKNCKDFTPTFFAV